jgi:hypothetical protein
MFCSNSVEKKTFKFILLNIYTKIHLSSSLSCCFSNTVQDSGCCSSVATFQYVGVLIDTDIIHVSDEIADVDVVYVNT